MAGNVDLQGKKKRLRFNSLRYLFPVVLVALVTAAGFPLQKILHPTNLLMLYLTVVVLAAIYTGRGPAILTSFLAMVSFDYFFIEPKLSLTVSDSQYFLTLLGFLSVALIVSGLTAQVKEQVAIVQTREAQTAVVNTLSRDLAAASGISNVLQVIVKHAGKALGGNIFILLPCANAKVKIAAGTPGVECITGAVQYAGVMLGGDVPADQEGLEDYHFIPLKTPAGIQGIMIVQIVNQVSTELDYPHQSEAFFNLAALAIERTHLEEKANQTRVLESSEKLQTALLRSISHDLRTPLAAISGVLDSLYESESANNSISLDKNARSELIQTGMEEVTRLNQLVSNILDMTRLEAGAIQLKLEEIDLQDLIGTSLSRMGSKLDRHPVKIHLDEELPFPKLDFVLMEQVLVNLLDNAVKYSSPGSPIEIEVHRQTGGVCIAIHDRGIGIPPESLDKIFDKFFRLKSLDNVSGSGLGLAICRGIVEAHGGQIWAENRPGGGSSFSILLPKLEETEAGENEV